MTFLKEIFISVVFCSLLSNVLEAEVNVDDIRVHRSKNGKADDTKTDMWIHVVDPESHNIMDTEDVIRQDLASLNTL